ncbi:NUDIX hydrolase [Rhizobium beringeri]
MPKGHVDDGEASSAAALREAFEEAGVVGIVDKTVFGTFSYRKDTGPNRYHVAVHLLQVSRIADKFPEKSIRKTQWFPLKDAVRDAAHRACERSCRGLSILTYEAQSRQIVVKGSQSPKENQQADRKSCRNDP